MCRDRLLGRAQPVIPPNLYYYNVYEHNSLIESPGIGIKYKFYVILFFFK